MITIPLQSFGLGDIIFTQTLAKAFGDPVLWGVDPPFVQGLQEAYPDVAFVPNYALNINYNQQHHSEKDGLRIIPIRWADTILKVPYSQCMRAKYDMYGLDYNIWKRDAMFEMKDKGLKQLLNIKEPYNIINEMFQSDFKGNKPIQVKNGARNIYIEYIDGFSLFDWAYLLKDAVEIHAVSSSILYILELLDLEQPLHLYPRPTDPNYSQVDYLFTKNYILH